MLSEALDPDSAPAGSAFQVRATGPDGITQRIAGTGTASIVGSTGGGRRWPKGVEDTALASVRYTKPDRDPLQDTEGNDANDFKTNRVVVIDEQPPVLKSAVVAGSELTIYYHEALDPDSVPVGQDFTVEVNNVTTEQVNSAKIVGNAVVLTLNEATTAARPSRSGTRRGRNRSGTGPGTTRRTWRQPAGHGDECRDHRPRQARARGDGPRGGERRCADAHLHAGARSGVGAGSGGLLVRVYCGQCPVASVRVEGQDGGAGTCNAAVFPCDTHHAPKTVTYAKPDRERAAEPVGHAGGRVHEPGGDQHESA